MLASMVIVLWSALWIVVKSVTTSLTKPDSRPCFQLSERKSGNERVVFSATCGYNLNNFLLHMLL